MLGPYELEFYESVRIFLKEQSGIFKYLQGFDTSHDTNGRVFIHGKFIRIKIENEKKQTSTAQKYYFVEASDIKKLNDPNLLVLSDYSEKPDFVLEIEPANVVSIELLIDYTVK
jgi:hypothetical protein